jgi:hypothetical protein
MSESTPPPPRDRDDEEREKEGEPEPEKRDRSRRLLERVLRDVVKKAVEKGVERVTEVGGRVSETPENLKAYLNEMKLPREVIHLIMQQVDDTKNGLYRAVAREIRDFLEHSNIAEELSRVLTTLSFEIKTEIRFIPNDQKIAQDKSGKLPKPDVKASVKIRDSRDGSES